jgi:two-component system chemotaxis response regulator CheB
MDVEMPEMDGLAAMAEIHRLYPRLPVIMFSTLTQRGAAQTVEALSLGAVDYVAKPANVGSVVEATIRLQGELIPKIKAHCRPGPVPFSRALGTVQARRPGTSAGFRCTVIAIGASTGGPHALNQVVPAFPAALGVPVVIVQHMPPVFTAMMAARLNEVSQVRVHEAAEGQPVEAGHAYIAPGGKHLEVAVRGAQTVAHLHEGPPENSCRPAVDVLFRSVARVYGAGALAVVLTGMGHDGMRGSQFIREAGGRVVAQDQLSSVVWGMPGAVAEAGLADEVVTLGGMAAAILARAGQPLMGVSRV